MDEMQGANPAKAEVVDREAADLLAVQMSKWYATHKANIFTCEALGNLARAYIAEREANAALRREVEWLEGICKSAVEGRRTFRAHRELEKLK